MPYDGTRPIWCLEKNKTDGNHKLNLSILCINEAYLNTRAAVPLAARWQLIKHRDVGPRENEMPTPPLLPDVKNNVHT